MREKVNHGLVQNHDLLEERMRDMKEDSNSDVSYDAGQKEIEEAGLEIDK